MGFFLSAIYLAFSLIIIIQIPKLQIRVVKAFQAGLDRREPSLSGPSAARLREISRQLKLQVENEGKGLFYCMLYD